MQPSDPLPDPIENAGGGEEPARLENSLRSLEPKGIDTDQLVYRAGFQDGFRHGQETPIVALRSRRFSGGSACVGGVVGALAASLVLLMFAQDRTNGPQGTRTASPFTTPTDETSIGTASDDPAGSESRDIPTVVPSFASTDSADLTLPFDGVLSTRSHYQRAEQALRSVSTTGGEGLAEPPSSVNVSLPLRRALFREVEQPS
ncbi:hypothetical protein Mal15_10980 [Stieleria maiorica]|uniref:Uncharacterized protein n=1 Tax=Stieleria maiorica TaxID=2795974 RepID=A0A5B9M8S8_9BACT|nr:hypothetical protein [Stieleria maiorica]QEF97063.1 hypothetical protein Mal15_10980 [Stieleria maiorica]